jgi:phytoene dehydrogenase-like protein
MKTDRSSDPVVIIGAGLSGLACAATLKKNNIPYLLIEKSNQVGGRVQTTVTKEGYRLDHGFQVLLTSYPELKNFINQKKLNLKLFNSGSLIFLKKTRLLANPLLHPSRFFKELFSDLTPFKDKFLVLKSFDTQLHKVFFNMLFKIIRQFRPNNDINFKR